MNRLICFLLLPLFFSCNEKLVKNNIGNNHVEILPGSTNDEIIRLAANVAPSEPQLRWAEMEFSAFIHFGINTFTDKESGEGDEDPKMFNPSELDAYQWVKVCKDAGMKQIILTAKHHDGFCLWPSKYTGHSVKNSPWKNGKGDVVKEVADACREMGVGFGVYLSPWDCNSPVFGDSPKYNEYFLNQLTELLTNYGRVDEVWFDGASGEGPNGKIQEYAWDDYYKLIRKLQPEAVIAICGPDVRWVGTETGYGRETEWSVQPVGMRKAKIIASDSQKDEDNVPNSKIEKQDIGNRQRIAQAESLIWFPSEADVSIRPSWFYHASQDSLVKSPEKLLDIYFSSIGRNSVLLLNIPPDKRGLIHENDIKALTNLKSIKDKMFAINYAVESRLSSDGKNAKATLDNNNKTYWTTKGGKEAGFIHISIEEPQIIDVLCLQENIRIGQRIEKFTLEYCDGGQWKVATRGTTVGYKRLLRFNPVISNEFRLKIEASRLNPTLSEIGIYKQPDF